MVLCDATSALAADTSSEHALRIGIGAAWNAANGLLLCWLGVSLRVLLLRVLLLWVLLLRVLLVLLWVLLLLCVLGVLLIGFLSAGGCRHNGCEREHKEDASDALLASSHFLFHAFRAGPQSITGKLGQPRQLS
jgi:hypothetical protein